MYLKLSARAAESDETYFMAVSNAEKLAEDVEKAKLGKETWGAFGSSCLF